METWLSLSPVRKRQTKVKLSNQSLQIVFQLVKQCGEASCTAQSLICCTLLIFKNTVNKWNQSQTIKSGSVTDSPSTMFPCLRKTLSSHHWQWTSLRNFFADSSACVGPLRTLTTTRTKCSNATDSSTSMPLLQRAAALQQMVRNQNSSLMFFFPPISVSHRDRQIYLATVATTMRAASSL